MRKSTSDPKLAVVIMITSTRGRQPNQIRLTRTTHFSCDAAESRRAVRRRSGFFSGRSNSSMLYQSRRPSGSAVSGHADPRYPLRRVAACAISTHCSIKLPPLVSILRSQWSLASAVGTETRPSYTSRAIPRAERNQIGSESSNGSVGSSESPR